MKNVKNFINKLSKSQKIICIISALALIFLLSIGLPTFARFKNRNAIDTTSVWDGSVASSYRGGTGTESDPYIISNGSELAYLSLQLSSESYDNTYFELSNNIVLNNGIFDYSKTDGIKYVLNNETYYVDDYTNKYYDNINLNGLEIGTINIFNTLNNFEGNFDGKSFTIYGLYITDDNVDQLSLFNNLEGNVHDLYVDNSLIYGGINTAGISGLSTDANISNVLFNGYVVGKSTDITKNINTNPTISAINLQNFETTNYMNLSNNVPFIGSDILSTTITGNYSINGGQIEDTTIKINGVTVTNGSFEISLGSSILTQIPVVTSITSEGASTLTFSNLKYNISYKYGVSGGLIGIANNTIIQNSINKGTVYSYSTSGGLVGVTTNLVNINQSYNTGTINSDHVSGGLIGTIEKSSNSVVINKSYNAADIFALSFGGLIGVIDNNSSSITISNTFNTSTTNYSIGTINNTVVNVNNAYYVNGISSVNQGSINGVFTQVSLDNLKNKDYIITNLDFDEFIDFNDLEENSQSTWVYEANSLPILFIDDINDPIASVNVGVNSWNNLSYDLSTVKLSSNITFSIEATNTLVPIKEKYYYINNSKDVLTKDEVLQISNWTSYNDVVQISTEGFYIIYVKVVDYDDNVKYINSDLLVLDLSGSVANVSIKNFAWSNLRDNLNSVYVDRTESVTVIASDSLSGVSSIKYYITDQLLNESSLNELNSSSWTNYTDPISISDHGKYIVYIQVIDNCNYKTYVNTDYIVFNGYSEDNLIIGRNQTSYLSFEPNITSKSSITLNYNYSNPSLELNGYTHNIISNILLPLNTKITLLDNEKNKVYEYIINTSNDIYDYEDSCNGQGETCIKVATYPLTLFKEVGADNKSFIEDSYYSNGMINEDFTLVLDFADTNIQTNYQNVSLYMELHDSNNNNVRPTLYDSIKKFSIYSNVDGSFPSASLSLTTDYSGSTIEFNSDSSTNINLSSKINYKAIDTNKIIDTTIEDMDVGIAIKLFDSSNNIVNREYLKNMSFKIGEYEYYPESDNTIRINLNNGITDIDKTLTISTSISNNDLASGTYYLKISSYVSYDGLYYKELTNNIDILVNVSTYSQSTNHGFDVIMDANNRIISKVNENVNVLFNIIKRGDFANPRIKIALYKKEQVTAYNQNYVLVDLKDYVSDNLTQYENSVYTVTDNPFEYDNSSSTFNNFALNIRPISFENTGYKFVFYLYSGTKKIDTIEKHFIVK